MMDGAKYFCTNHTKNVHTIIIYLSFGINQVSSARNFKD